MGRKSYSVASKTVNLDETLLDLNDDKLNPILAELCLPSVVEDDRDKLVGTLPSIEMELSGKSWYDPGRLSGPPENCYPPEGEEDVEIDGVTVRWNGHEPRRNWSHKDYVDTKEMSPLFPNLMAYAEEIYEKESKDMDWNENEPDYPEPED